VSKPFQGYSPIIQESELQVLVQKRKMGSGRKRLIERSAGEGGGKQPKKQHFVVYDLLFFDRFFSVLDGCWKYSHFILLSFFVVCLCGLVGGMLIHRDSQEEKGKGE